VRLAYRSSAVRADLPEPAGEALPGAALIARRLCEIDQAALLLIARRGGEIAATARRYAATTEDAEDAYQCGLEVLLRKDQPLARTSSFPG
jgi:hypothetical protein